MFLDKPIYKYIEMFQFNYAVMIRINYMHIVSSMRHDTNTHITIIDDVCNSHFYWRFILILYLKSNFNYISLYDVIINFILACNKPKYLETEILKIH